jgi:hypothetical protein
VGLDDGKASIAVLSGDRNKRHEAMKSYSWIVFTNCTPGSEQAFEAWYDDIHIPDLLRIPGIVSATRGRATPQQTLMVGGAVQYAPSVSADYRYLAVYKLRTDDPSAVLREVVRRSGTPEMELSDAMTDAHTILFEDL